MKYYLNKLCIFNLFKIKDSSFYFSFLTFHIISSVGFSVRSILEFKKLSSTHVTLDIFNKIQSSIIFKSIFVLISYILNIKYDRGGKCEISKVLKKYKLKANLRHVKILEIPDVVTEDQHILLLFIFS